MSGRRPPAPAKKMVFRAWCRCLLAGLGAGLAYCGSLPRSPANFIVLDWRGRFGYPSSVMPIGVVMIVVAVLPASWIERAFERLVSSSTGDRRE